MSDPAFDLAHVRAAHAAAVRALKAEGVYATPVPTLADCAVALRRLGVAMPRAQLARLLAADLLPTADRAAERDAVRARRG